MGQMHHRKAWWFGFIKPKNMEHAWTSLSEAETVSPCPLEQSCKASAWRPRHQLGVRATHQVTRGVRSYQVASKVQGEAGYACEGGKDEACTGVHGGAWRCMGQDVGKCSSLMHMHIHPSSGGAPLLEAEGIFLTCRHGIPATVACPCER